MTSSSARPQLVFEIDSAGAANTIYVTSKASDNDLTLKLATTATATFTPAATVVDRSLAGTVTGSLLYLDLTPLNLSAQEFAAIAPATTGWTFVSFPATNTIGMTPVAATTLDPGATIDLHIGALAAAEAQGATASLVVWVYRVGGITTGNLGFPTNLSVALATPPHGGEDLAQDLQVALLQPNVVNSVPGYDAVENQLSIAFLPGQRGRPVTPGTNSQFVLSFVYATDPNGYGALCTPDQVKPPFAVVAGVNAGSWQITANLDQQSPSWTLVAPTTGPVVTPKGPSSTVGINVNNLVTNFQPGPTVALVSYSGFDGYEDGVFTLLIEKVPHVRIDSLTVRPNPAVLDGGSAKVTVSWEASDAGTMMLAPFGEDVTGKSSYDATITETTQITLTAQGKVLASAGNVALRNVTAAVLPVINSFEARPRAVYAGDLPREVELAWNVNTNGQLELRSSVGPVDPNRYNSKGSVGKTIAAPQLFTLVPLDQSVGTTVQRSVAVSAFAPQMSSWTVSARSLAAPPNASFVLASDGVGSLVAVDTMVYQPVSASVPVGSNPAGMVFSADGGTLYVANSGDNTVSQLAVVGTGAVPQYTFTTTSTTSVSGSPRELALSPDGKYLYVTLDGGGSTGQLAVLTTAGTPAVLETLNIGFAPRGVAAMPSGAQIFVANSGSATVSVIGRGHDGNHTVVDTIPGLNSATDVAVTPDGNVVLVTSPPANAVFAINALHPQAPRATLAVGANPQQIALVPGGAYAAVSAAGDASVALVRLGSSPAQCSVMKAGIEVGANPGAIAATPDGGLLLVGTGAGLSVLTLAEYQTAQTPPLIGGQPTSVVVAPDGGRAVAWHNTLSWFSRGTPSTGLFVYDATSQTVAPQLATTLVVDFAFHPVASAKSAFLVDSTHAKVQIVDTSTWTVTGDVDFSGQTTGLALAVATSTDATKLFVLTQDTGLKTQLVIYGLQGTPLAYVPLGTVTLLTAKSGSATTLAASPDGSKAYVTEQLTGSLLVVALDAGSYKLAQTVALGSTPSATALSPDGARLYVSGSAAANGNLAAVDTTTLAVRNVVLPASSWAQLTGIAVTPDGSRVIACDRIAAGVRIFDAASLRLVQTISWASGVQLPNGIAIAPDESLIFTANTNSGNLGVVAQVQGDASLSRATAPIVAAEVQTPVGLADAPYQGLFLRDFLGQTPSSVPNGAWTTCPDIWPSGQGPLSDPQTTLVAGYGNDAPNTIFVQSGGAANYVYVRGLNATNGPNTSRVWLYYVNGSGDASMMLWPPSWSNAGIATSQGPHQYVEVSSAKLNDVDYTYPSFVWSAVPVTGHYCIIAWVENPPLSQPAADPRGGIGSIGSYAQLAAFVQSHPNMGWKNTEDIPTTSGQTWTTPMQFGGPPRGSAFKVGVQLTNVPVGSSFSFVVEGPKPGPPWSVNIPKTPVTAPDATYLVPIDWTGYDNFQGTMQVTYYAGTTQMPQGANIQAQAGSNTVALVGLVDDPLAGARLVDVYPTGNLEDAPEAGWLSIVGSVQLNLIPATSLAEEGASGARWMRTFPIEGPPSGGALRVGVQLEQIPVASVLRFTLPGGDGVAPVDTAPIAVTASNQALLVAQDWPPNYVTTMTVYLTLSEPPPPGASVEAIISMTVGDEPDAADGIEVVGTCSIADGGDAPVAEDATE